MQCNWQVIDYCAEEVARQSDSPRMVSAMLRAWSYAMDRGHGPITEEHVLNLAAHVTYDERGYRGVPVSFGPGKPLAYAPSPDEVPKHMARWFELLHTMTPQQAYHEFEIIHPFKDGNGRVGKIAYNWLNESLAYPLWPKDEF